MICLEDLGQNKVVFWILTVPFQVSNSCEIHSGLDNKFLKISRVLTHPLRNDFVFSIGFPVFQTLLDVWIHVNKNVKIQMSIHSLSSYFQAFLVENSN